MLRISNFSQKISRKQGQHFSLKCFLHFFRGENSLVSEIVRLTENSKIPKFSRLNNLLLLFLKLNS